MHVCVRVWVCVFARARACVCCYPLLCIEYSREEFGSPGFPGVLLPQYLEDQVSAQGLPLLLERATSTAERMAVQRAGFLVGFGIGTQRGHSFYSGPPSL